MDDEVKQLISKLEERIKLLEDEAIALRMDRASDHELLIETISDVNFLSKTMAKSQKEIMQRFNKSKEPKYEALADVLLEDLTQFGQIRATDFMLRNHITKYDFSRILKASKHKDSSLKTIKDISDRRRIIVTRT